MKKAILGALFAGAMLASCSSDEPVVGPDNGNQDAGTRYLSVSIVSTPDAIGTRADDYTGDPDGNSKYEDGSTTENTVSKVRFYFFDENEDAANVRHNTANYYDWESPAGSGIDHDHSVEKQLNAVLVISTKEGDKLPKYIVAVLNPTVSVLGTGSLSLNELRTKTENYATLANASTNTSFVMANSVYMNAANAEVKAQAIKPENFAKTEGAATQAPVLIYVERNVAKVRMNVSGLDNNNRIKAKTNNNGTATDIKVDGQDVYIQFEGWNVTGDVDKGTLSKSINTSWTDDNLGFTWNHYPYFRSFWAEACSGVANQYGNYDAAKSKGFTAETKYTYCNENAEKGTGVKNTQVILAGKLCKADGTALNISEFAGQRMVDDATQTKLKNAYLAFLRNLGYNLYKKTTNGAEIKYTGIGVDDITFKTATVVDKKAAGSTGAYYVYCQLTEDAEKASWYPSDDKSQAEDKKVLATTINGYLKNIGHAKIWNSGKTYFYADIKHLGTKMTGVVRNHLYDFTITGIYGLGTPVYDPNETIYPEKPEDEDTYIAAKINILSWRVVPNSTTLDWGK